MSTLKSFNQIPETTKRHLGKYGRDTIRSEWTLGPGARGVGTTPEGNYQTSHLREAQGMNLDKEQGRRVPKREVQRNTQGRATEKRS